MNTSISFTHNVWVVVIKKHGNLLEMKPFVSKPTARQIRSLKKNFNKDLKLSNYYK